MQRQEGDVTGLECEGRKDEVDNVEDALTKLFTLEAGPLAPEPDRKTMVGSLSELEAPSGTLTQ